MTDTDSTEPGPPNVGAPPDVIEPPDAERVIEIARELIAFDTSNPPGDTRAITDWIDRFLVDHGVDTERIATDPAKPNLVATIPGGSARTLLYNGHADTVPYDTDEWRHDPLGERDGGRLYGRGATDMKGPLAAMLAAVEAIVETDTDPPVTLALAVVSDEETARRGRLAPDLGPPVPRLDGGRRDGSCPRREPTRGSGAPRQIAVESEFISSVASVYKSTPPRLSTTASTTRSRESTIGVPSPIFGQYSSVSGSYRSPYSRAGSTGVPSSVSGAT